MAYLSDKKYFTEAEFADSITGEVKLQKGFITELDNLRERYAKPMIVTDGCRSQEKIRWLLRRGYPASKNSFHLIGNKKYGTDCCAVDIARPNGKDLHLLMRMALYLDWTVGLGDTFLHLDKRVLYTKLPAIIYTYK